MTFDAWYHGFIGFVAGWMLAGLFIFHGWKITARITSLAFRLTNRCDFCKRSFMRCWKKNTCEQRQAAQLQWKAQVRKVIIPSVGFLGQLLTNVAAAEHERGDSLETPDLTGDVKPPNA